MADNLLLLHAFPHRHTLNYDHDLFICYNKPGECKVDFQLKNLPEHPIGYDIEIQYCTNLYDPSGKNWSYHSMSNVTTWFVDNGHVKTYTTPTYYGVKSIIDHHRKTPILFHTSGSVEIPSHSKYGYYEITFRGRYKAKFTDDWTDWSYIGERDYFGFEKNATIVYFKPNELTPSVPTNLNHVCIDCVLKSCNGDMTVIPESIKQKAIKHDFVCNICHINKLYKQSTASELYRICGYREGAYRFMGMAAQILGTGYLDYMSLS